MKRWMAVIVDALFWAAIEQWQEQWRDERIKLTALMMCIFVGGLTAFFMNMSAR